MGSISAGSGARALSDIDVDASVHSAFAKRVRTLYPRFDDLVAASEAVEGLVTHPGWDHLMRLLEAEITVIDAGADGRLLATRADYAFAHGRKGGLRGARDAAQELLRFTTAKVAEQRTRHEADEPRALAAERG